MFTLRMFECQKVNEIFISMKLIIDIIPITHQGKRETGIIKRPISQDSFIIQK